MMHELLPMHVASRLSGKKKTRRKGDTKLGEIRITYYIAMNPTRLRKVTRSVQVCSNEMIGCCTIRRISRIYLHARLTKPTHVSGRKEDFSWISQRCPISMPMYRGARALSSFIGREIFWCCCSLVFNEGLASFFFFFFSFSKRKENKKLQRWSEREWKWYG